MATVPGALTAKDGALWIQLGGPNTKPEFLGCHDLGDLGVPEGGIELLRKFKPDGSGWDVVGQKITPPDPVTVSISTLLFKQRDYVERARCPFTLFILQRNCGNADVFSNYVRGQILANVRRTNRTYAGLVMREEDAESTVESEMEAWPPLLDVDELQVERVDTLSALALNDMIGNRDERCVGDCGLSIERGEHVYAGSDASAMVAGAVLRSRDFGGTYAALAASPFAAGVAKHILGLQRFPFGRTAYRIVAVKAAEAAGQGLVAYSDDEGATWTQVNLGGAAAGHGGTFHGCLFALDSQHIWLVSAVGYVYFSDDGGETWTAQDAGLVTAGNYACVHFADEFHGVAGAAADVIALTEDGGETWYAATATGGGGDIQCCFRIDANRIWVGDDDGKLWFSTDGGESWTQRTGWTGSATGDIRAIGFANELQAFMVHDDVASMGHVLRTIDGGFTWDRLKTPDNDGLNGLFVAHGNLAYVAGEVEAGAAVAVTMKVSPANV